MARHSAHTTATIQRRNVRRRDMVPGGIKIKHASTQTRMAAMGKHLAADWNITCGSTGWGLLGYRGQ